MSERVVNLAEVELLPSEKGERFASRDAQLGPLIGARDLGCSLTVVPPGERYPEVVEYPDSGKVLAYDGEFGLMVHRSADVDYWDGEA